jgi:hypothetical protein
MRQNEVQVGATYAAKVSGRLVPVTVLQAGAGRAWIARNETTGRILRLRTAARLRFRVDRGSDGWYPAESSAWSER